MPDVLQTTKRELWFRVFFGTFCAIQINSVMQQLFFDNIKETSKTWKKLLFGLIFPPKKHTSILEKAKYMTNFEYFQKQLTRAYADLDQKDLATFHPVF